MGPETATERRTRRRPTAFGRRELRRAAYLGVGGFFLWSAEGSAPTRRGSPAGSVGKRRCSASPSRREINVPDSTTLWSVGAGGIGVQPLRAVNAFAWQSVAMIPTVPLGAVLASEALSADDRGLTR